MSCVNADTLVSLATRPVLFALARALGEAWPGDVPRDVLLARAFGARFVDESHRARLRVEIGRLRRMLRPLAAISATQRGFALKPSQSDARSSCWPGPSKKNMAQCLPSSPTVSRGRVRPWRLPSAPASAPCSGHSIACSSGQSAVVWPGASPPLDQPRPCRDSRRFCYSPAPLPGD